MESYLTAICKALDNGLEVRLFCDMSNAFNRVWHKGLVYMLKRVGINVLLLGWLSDYLTNMQQRFVLPGAILNWQFISRQPSQCSPTIKNECSLHQYSSTS